MALLAPGTTIGRYTVLGAIASGGMSELYLARQVGQLGFQKVLVLKVILPEFAEEDRFIRMFQNEAKLAAMLNHPGVVQVYDFGVEQGMHYLAMEYIDGLPLSRISARMREQGRLWPVPLVCRIGSDVCGALEYAHSLADADGSPLQIIHRDVSLENILLTYSGQPKLVDFGLARARTMASNTTQGTLKGKYRYMAPEMLMGNVALDHRIDLFAVGVLLYGLVTNRLPFGGQSHVDILRSILEDPPIAPRQLNPEVPYELEAIILRALAKDREQRYQRAKELQEELEACLARTAASTYHLAQFMAATFPPGSDPTRITYQKLAGVHTPQVVPATGKPAELCSVDTVIFDEQEPRTARPTVVERGGGHVSPTTQTSPIAIRETITVPFRETPAPPPLEQGGLLSGEQAGSVSSTFRLIHGSRIRRSLIVAGLLLAGVGSAVLAAYLSSRRPAGNAGSAGSAGRADASSPRDGGPGASPRTPREATVPLDAALLDRRLADHAATHPRAVDQTLAPARGRLRISIWPWAEVSVDGRQLGTTPLRPLTVSEGAHLVVIENRPLGVRRELKVRVQAGKESVVRLKLR